MRLTGARAYARPAPTPTMPPGLVELMEGLAKDVLKNSPENVYDFCAGHMQKLLEIRDGTLPPKRQLSLEEKIARAQEKIRQKNKNKEVQLAKNDSQLSTKSGSGEEEKEQPVKYESNISQQSSENRGHDKILNLESVIQPFVHGDELVMLNEVEIFHEPNMTIATNDINNEELKTGQTVAVAMKTLENSTENMIDEISQNSSHETSKVERDVAGAMQTVEVEKSAENVNVDLNENTSEDKNEVEGDVGTAIQTLEFEKVNDDINENTGDDTLKVEGDIASAVHTIEFEKSTEIVNDDINENVSDDTHKVEGDVEAVIQTQEFEKSTEKANNDINENTGDDTHNIEGDGGSAMQTDEKVNGQIIETMSHDTKQTSNLDVALATQTLKHDKSTEKRNDEIIDNTGSYTYNVQREVVTATPTLELEKSTEKVNDNIIENTSINKVEKDVTAAMPNLKLEKSIEKVIDEIENISDMHKVEREVAASMQNLEFGNSTEKVNDKIIKNTSNDTHNTERNAASDIQTDEKVNEDIFETMGDDTKETSNLKPIVESEDVAIENELKNEKIVFEHTETELDDLAKCVIDVNDAEDKTVTLTLIENSENTKDKLKEKSSPTELDDNSKTIVADAFDAIFTNDATKYEENIKKEEITDINDENIINVQTEENAGSMQHAPVDDKTFSGKTVNVVELIDNQPKIIQQNITLLNEIKQTTDNEAPDTEGPKAVNDQVITVRIVEKPLDDYHQNNDDKEIKHDPNTSVNKQETDTNDKLPVQNRANSEEISVKVNDVLHYDTAKGNANNTMLESEETTGTAVSGMDLETAAITIQKVFRSFLFSKSRTSTLDDSVMGNSLEEDIDKKNFQDEPEYVLTSTNLNKERRTLGISRMDTVLQTVNEEKSLSISDDSSLSSAATTIQAHVRGFLVRNRLASNKTASSSSLVNSDGPSTVSLDGDTNEHKKTVLNIHIVPERGQFLSRDESLLTSIDLPLDNSPPSSINLHPLGYDKSERRKQLKREDAIQSISPPSNNSGKLSEDVDSVNDAGNESVNPKSEYESISVNDAGNESVNPKSEYESISVNGHDKPTDPDTESCDTPLTVSSTAETVIDVDAYHTREALSSPEHNLETDTKTREAVINSSSDEMDVVTPFPTLTEKQQKVDHEEDEKPKLIHSGEFHDIVIQTQVKRTETSVVREFKNVLVYFLLWDKT